MRELFVREIHILLIHPIYLICMVVMPLFVTFFFTSLMDEGVPTDIPIGIVDLDQTTTTRKLTRMVDAFQSTKVAAHYPTMAEARHAIQRNEIYGFILFPKDMTSDMLAFRQPKMSFYYSNTSMTAGSLIYKDMKTVCTLAAAGIGQGVMQAKGMTPEQIKTALQPITLDTHLIGNPWASYNIYLSFMLIPGTILLLIFLVTVYSLGIEIKFRMRRENDRDNKGWLEMAHGDFGMAIFTKILPQTIVFVCVFILVYSYLFGWLHFPHPGGFWRIMLLTVIGVISAQGFGVFIFGLIPSMRMAMSVSSLWGVLSFSMAGTAFPIFAMDAPLQSISWMFPMRHYYLIYQLCILNTYPLTDVLIDIFAMLSLAFLPLLVIKRIERAFVNYEYEP